MSKGFVWSGWIQAANESKPTSYMCLGIDMKTGEIESYYLDRYGNKTNKETKDFR